MRAVIVATLLVATSCATSTTDRVADQAPTVDWQNYSPDLQAQIDRSPCRALQRQFDNAEANNAAQRNRTGDGNADLMGYIIWAMERRSC